MNRRGFIGLIGGIAIGCSDDMVNLNINSVVSGGGVGGSINGYVFLILDIGQSNSIGRAESQRLDMVTTYAEVLSGVKIFYKPSYTVSDDGEFLGVQIGSRETKEPDLSASFRLFGAYCIIADKIASVSENNVYIIPVGDGGTSLHPNVGGTRDWSPASTNECFDTAFDYYYAFAYSKVQTENPEKTIIPIVLWHQGENDAADATATSSYAVNFANFMVAARAAHASLANAMFILTKLYYNIDANETTINNALQAYADANSDLVKIIDISDMPRKQDLTVAQKAGITPTASDDQHTSYLGQIAKGERAYVFIKERYFPGFDDSEITNNVAFDPATIISTGVRLQGSRANLSVDSNNKITAITNHLSTGTFNSFNGTIPPHLKISGRKGWIGLINGGVGYIRSSAAIGTSLFAGSWSFAAWIKPRDGQPTAAYHVFHDVQSTGTPNNSRVAVTIEPSGKIYGYIAISGTVKQFQTNAAVFNDGLQLAEKHIAVTATQGDFFRVYVDGVLQNLDPTLDGGGNISSLTLSNYVNNTNALTLFARKSGTSTYDFNFLGLIREITIQRVVYSQSDILNLMKN